MKIWTERGVCSENYLITDGTPPHCTWGVLLDLIGLEALVDWGKDFTPAPRKSGGLTDKIIVRNVPFGGKLYKIEYVDGKVKAEPEKPLWTKISENTQVFSPEGFGSISRK